MIFDYSSILLKEEINLGHLDNVTLIDWEFLELGYDEDERYFLVIEVWLDEGNAIKVLQQSEGEYSKEISDRLSKEELSHIHILVKKKIEKGMF